MSLSEEIIEFRIPLAEIPRNPLKNENGRGRMVNEFLKIRHVSNVGRNGPKLHIDYIDIFAPHYEQWPPESHKNIFPDVGGIDEIAKAKTTLVRFMRKAWRRPISELEIERFMGLYASYRPEFKNMEGAMLEVMATVLASPDFLYINHGDTAEENSSKRISQLELASRLSFFLWSSIPDEELFNLAERNVLSEPKVLASQVQRMLSDERGKRFSENFVEQWLGLEGIESISVDKKAHGSYNLSLQEASVYEPIALFKEVLEKNLSILDFIQSDYLMINQTLAHHYGIPGVYGSHFRKVMLGGNTQRGGLMTTAGVMTVSGTWCP